MKAFAIEDDMGFVLVLAKNKTEAKTKYKKWVYENCGDSSEIVSIEEATKDVFPIAGYGE